MNKRKVPQDTGMEPILITVEMARARYNLGRSSIIKIGEETGAIVRIGRSLRINAGVLDKAFTK